MALSDADATVIVGLVSAVLGTGWFRQAKVEKRAKAQLTAEVQTLVDQLRSEVKYLRGELRYYRPVPAEPGKGHDDQRRD